MKQSNARPREALPELHNGNMCADLSKLLRVLPFALEILPADNLKGFKTAEATVGTRRLQSFH
jgi:hypothetical protein